MPKLAGFFVALCLTVSALVLPSSALAFPPVSYSASGIGPEPHISKISDEQWSRMVDEGVWRPGCPAGRADLRRLDVNYVDFAGRVRRGSLVAHKDSIGDLARVFSSLFVAAWPIASMLPAEEFGGNVNAGLTANNTSAFNCRKPGQANAPALLSPHANGRAVDINPLQNPWKDPRCACWNPSPRFAHDRFGPGVITRSSLPYKLFARMGWVWQDIKVPDYMHFDTGYPSRPR